MTLQFNFFNVLILAGCVQGIVLALVLFGMNEKSRSRFFLGLLLMAYSLNNLNAVFVDTKLSNDVPALLICPFSLIFAIGPALYLHTRFTLGPALRFRRIDLLHFLPALVELLWYTSLSVIFWRQPTGIRSFYHQYEAWYSLPEQLGGIISVFFYLVASLRLLKKNREVLKLQFSAIADLAYKNLRLLIVFLLLGWIAWLALILADVIFFNFNLAQSVYYPLYIVMSATVYAIGYSGYFRKVIIIEPTSLVVEKDTPVKKENFSDPEMALIAERLRQLMDAEKMYLDPSLRLKMVADAVPCTQQRLSGVLNGLLDKSFYDFVNGYRVRDVQSKLVDPSFNHWTLTAIAYECGFNSKSTFNEIFKKNTGQTPKEFKNQAQNNVREIYPDVSPTESA